MTGHSALAAGRWTTFTLAEQMANVGSEVDRAIAAWRADRSDRFDQALARALELFDLTARDERWRGHRRREVLRAREEFCRLFFDTESPAAAAPTLSAYFLRFAVLARRQAADRARAADSQPASEPRIPRRDAAELRGAPTCWVCLQLEDEDRTRATQVLVALVGAAAYAVCVRCGQEAPDCHDASYVARARRHLGALES